MAAKVHDEKPKQRSEQKPELLPGISRHRRIAVLAAALSTVNGALLIIQSTIGQPPLDVALPAWVYAAVNGAVVLGAGIAKLASLVMRASSALTSNDAEDSRGGSEQFEDETR